MGRRVLRDEEISFLETFAKKDTTVQNLIATIRDRDKKIVELREISQGWRAHSDDLQQALIDCDKENAILLEALEEILDNAVASEMYETAQEIAREAIAKVKGR